MIPKQTYGNSGRSRSRVLGMLYFLVVCLVVGAAFLIISPTGAPFWINGNSMNAQEDQMHLTRSRKKRNRSNLSSGEAHSFPSPVTGLAAVEPTSTSRNPVFKHGRQGSNIDASSVEKDEFPSNHACANITSRNVSTGPNHTLANATVNGGTVLSAVVVVGGWVHIRQIEEWLIWHHYVGVERFIFYLVNADSRVVTFLAEFSSLMPIHVFQVRERGNFWQGDNGYIMKTISTLFSRGLNEFRESSEWMTFIDIDEVGGGLSRWGI